MKGPDRVFVAGGGTLLGAAILRRLEAEGHAQCVADAAEGLDLADGRAVDAFFREARPAYVFLAAGLSGGIAANIGRPADLMRNNLLVTTHVLDSACRHGVRKLLYLASSCCYPRLCPQPMREDALFSGPLEPTNEAYATAKRAGIVLCQAYAAQHGARFVSAIPANPFGPGDDFRPDEGHVIPSLIARFHTAKTSGQPEVVVWGTGTPRREFVFADDLADAALFVMKSYEGPGPINLGGGADLSIAELAHAIAAVVGYRGRILFDPTRPDGMPMKRLDAERLRAMGWQPTTPLPIALEQTYRWHLRNGAAERCASLHGTRNASNHAMGG